MENDDRWLQQQQLDEQQQWEEAVKAALQRERDLLAAKPKKTPKEQNHAQI
jgi:hypothetical protein